MKSAQLVGTYIRKYTIFGNICTILENGRSFDCRVQMTEKCAKFRKNVQTYEKSAEFREMFKVMRKVQNSEKYARFRETFKVQRNVQDT